MKTLDNSGNSMLFKELSKVFQSFKRFSFSNTIFIDDEPYKALCNHDNTSVFPVTYDPNDEKGDLLDPKGEFCSYLEGMANSLDVQGYIKEHSFGQPKIDSSHPEWSYQCLARNLHDFMLNFDLFKSSFQSHSLLVCIFF